MNYYLLFAGNDYYPTGGMGDFVGVYESPRQCRDAATAENTSYDWANFVFVGMGGAPSEYTHITIESAAQDDEHGVFRLFRRVAAEERRAIDRGW